MEQRTRPPDEAWEPWESPYDQAPFGEPAAAPPPRGSRWDFRPLFMLLEAVRRGLPGELQLQFTALVREILLTLRAVIDWYLERLDSPPAGPEVEDIPID
jgi:hypothetical protein